LLKKSIRGLFDSDHPWSSPYGRYYVAPNFSPGEIVNTQSKKRGFCFASFFKHLACLKNGGTSLYRDGQEAQVPRSAWMRESGHRRVLKNEFFSTLLAINP